MDRSDDHGRAGWAIEDISTRALQAVSEALVGATTDLSLDAVLERLVHAARDLVGARYAALGVPDGEGGFARFITSGMSDELVESLGPLPRSHGMLDAILHQTTPYRSGDIHDDARFRGWWPQRHPDMRSLLGYPIVFKGDVIAAFYFTEKEGAASFDETDEQLVGVFAPHAAVLIEYARLYEQSRELSVAAERTRMAHELHDALTQSLFGARLAIQTATGALAEGSTGEGDLDTALEQLSRAETSVDSAFRELRALILDLRPPDLDIDEFTAAIRKQLALVQRTSDLDVRVEIADGIVVPDPDIEQQVFRIFQEAVANVVRHASATQLTVSVSQRDASLVIEVRDDGVGFDPSHQALRSRRLGLTSMLDRARSLRGTLSIESSPGAGTAVRAEVPIGRPRVG